MHSSGQTQTKADLLRDLAGKTFFAGLTYSNQTTDVVDYTGTAIATVDQVKNLYVGKTRASQIKVLQTWVHSGGDVVPTDHQHGRTDRRLQAANRSANEQRGQTRALALAASGGSKASLQVTALGHHNPPFSLGWF